MKNLISKTIKSEIIWWFIKPFAKVGHKIYILRNSLTHIPNIPTKVEIPNYLKDSIVLNGPFKGMRYPQIESVGSAIYPKLIGSYEKEIQSALLKLCKKNNYTEIIDIGCAEGYYAVGLALISENSKIHAYDTNESAQHLCLRMAQLNKVAQRVSIGSTITPEKLQSFKFTKRGLIICDCEGYEKDLFTKSSILNLKSCDLIIEAHDFKDIEITNYLKKIIEPTHNIESIYSVDDIQKALTYNYPQTENLDLNEKKRIFREWRPSIMEWLVCTPKT